MTRALLDLVSVPRSASLLDALQSIDKSGHHVALLVDADGTLAGLVTDGDLRRAILAGADLSATALPYATTSPQTVEVGSARALVLDLMRARRISAVPEVTQEGHLVGLHTLSGVVGVDPIPNPAVIMAGGRGTRLGALTRTTPKPLVEVAGRTILEWIVLNLVGGGIADIHVSVNHLADQIEEHLGDGSRFGARVDYLREQPDRPLGTAGSLSLLRASRADLDVPVIVMNGDLMVQFEPSRLLEFHTANGAAITVATRNYQHEVPFGVVETDRQSMITGFREKPTVSLDINAGVYAVSPEVLDSMRQDEPCTMPELIQSSLEAGAAVIGWPLASDWIDIGTPSDLARAKGAT